MAAKTRYCAKMPIYANQRVGKWRSRCHFFFHQKMRNRQLGNTEKERKKSFRVLTGDAKNENMGPNGPPLFYMH